MHYHVFIITLLLPIITILPIITCYQRGNLQMKFKEAEGASERPNAIKYLSVHCNILQLILCLTSEASKVPVCRFLQTAQSSSPKQPGIPHGKVGFLASLGVLCWQCCVVTRCWRKQWLIYRITHIIIEQVLYG